MGKKKFSWSKTVYDKGKLGTFYYAYYGNEELGYIAYYSRWRKWVWEQTESIIMSYSCLKEVVKKLKQLEVK